VELDKAEVAHILKVKRHSTGDVIEVVDGKGTRLKVQITNTTPLDFQVVEVAREVPSRRVIAVVPLLKSERMVQAVENAVELGATDLIFWQANRSIAKWTDQKTAQMHNLVVKSGKQSRRAYFPVILGAFNSKAMFKYLDALPNKRIIVLHEAATEDINNSRGFELVDSTILVVGPEGGIAPEELEAFEELGAEVYKICPTVLRSATAISAGLAVIYNLSKTD
jgi:16S rRNA (uracil1498-N3)-methyltransferase